MQVIAVEIDISEIEYDDRVIRERFEKLFRNELPDIKVIDFEEDENNECDFAVEFGAFNYDDEDGRDFYSVSLRIVNNKSKKSYELQTSGKGVLTVDVIEKSASELFALGVGTLQLLMKTKMGR